MCTSAGRLNHMWRRERCRKDGARWQNIARPSYLTHLVASYLFNFIVQWASSLYLSLSYSYNNFRVGDVIVFSTSTMYRFTLCAYLMLFFGSKPRLYIFYCLMHILCPNNAIHRTAPPTGRADPLLPGNGCRCPICLAGKIVSRVFGSSALSYLLSKYKIITIRIKKVFV